MCDFHGVTIAQPITQVDGLCSLNMVCTDLSLVQKQNNIGVCDGIDIKYPRVPDLGIFQQNDSFSDGTHDDAVISILISLPWVILAKRQSDTKYQHVI